jgi:hypothetical protein
MRITITIDSATTEEIRSAMVGLHWAGHTAELRTGVNGPECWKGTTPPLQPDEFVTFLETFTETLPTQGVAE